jgi:hypothetical protein
MSKRLKNRNSGHDKKLAKLLERAKKMLDAMPIEEVRKMRTDQAESWSRQDKD